MDIWFVLNAFWTAVSTLWSAFWGLVAKPYVGWIFLVAALWGLYRIYRLLPERVQKATGSRVSPYAWFATRPFRWPIGLWLTSDYDREGRSAAARVEEKIVIVHARRSFRLWLRSGFRWGLFYLLVYVAYTYWSSIWPYIH